MMYAGVPETTVRLTRLQAEARQAEEAKELQRKRNLMVLILSHLQKYGYLNSLECLQREANVSLQSVTAADNVDLLSVLQEFEVYYHIKFNRKVKLVRKLSAAESSFADDISKQAAQKRPLPRINNAREGDQKKENVAAAASPRTSRVKCGPDQAEPQRGDSGVDIGVTGTTITAGDRKRAAQPDAPHFSTKEIDAALDECRAHLANGRHLAQHVVAAAEPRPKSAAGCASRPATPPGLYEDKLLKPLPAEYALNSEFRDLAGIIRRDIFQANPNVRWSDIAGLADSKRLVKEAVVYPLKYPQ